MSPLQLSNEFRRHCQERILGTFSDRGREPPAFRPLEGELQYLSGQFQLQERTFTIEIYDKTVVMHEGNNMYECYLREEFKSEETLIDGFTRRLGRFLSGGTWEEPNEKGLIARIRGAIGWR